MIRDVVRRFVRQALKASDEPSDNDPRQRPTERDVLRH
jgi:hypothetical protein